MLAKGTDQNPIFTIRLTPNHKTTGDYMGEGMLSLPRPNHTSRVLLYSHENTCEISVHLRLNNMLLNSQWIKQKVKRLINLETNEKITYQSLWKTENTVQRRKFMAVNDYIN